MTRWTPWLSLRGALLLAITLAAAPIGLNAQDAATAVDAAIQSEQFQAPDAALAEAALAPRWLNVTLTQANADGTWFLDEVGDGPISMERFSKPFHELGGLFIDFAANRDRNLTRRSNAGIDVISAEDGSRTSLEIPRGVRVSAATWSPDGSRIAFFGHTDTETHIYVGDPMSGSTRQVTRRPVLATLATTFEWTEDSRSIATVLVPDDRSAMPVAPTVPQGPQVKVAETDDMNRLRTYASLMATPHDRALLEWHATGQLALIDVERRRANEIGDPDMIRSFDVSPDGQYVRVTRMVKPFSYIVPVNNFGRVEEIWGMDGSVLAEVHTTPLNVGVTPGQTPTAPGVGGGNGQQAGPREIAWRPDGSGLTYLEQEAPPEDDAEAGAEEQEEEGRDGRSDRVMQWLPPFDEASRSVLFENDSRMSGHRYSEDMSILFASETTRGQIHEFAVRLDDPSETHTLARYEQDDVYAHPGSLVGVRGPLPAGGAFARFRRGGASADIPIRTSPDGTSVYYLGTAYDENPLEVGPRSFIDRVEIETGDKTRVFESDNDGVYERVVAIQDIEAGRFVVSRESKTEIAQSFARNGDALTQLTENVDYTPDLTTAPRESFVVERPDGFKFKVNVTLPPGYQEGTRLPAMFWFYPREYAGQEEYDEGARTFNKNAFPNFGTRSIQYLVRLGYAVVEPDAPIVGPDGKWNNNYENDLRNNLAAAIDEVDRRGFVDRSRMGIGGHSYGAFSTANALAHTPFFKAGIAGDGNYNRTLTPLNFQRERRDLWEARETYLNMSPLLHANNMTGALLLYHGMDDQNVGTHPSHSPRLFHALNGLGKTVSMYLYPFEDHGPATRETVLDLWARWSAWLDKYVKSGGEVQPRATTSNN